MIRRGHLGRFACALALGLPLLGAPRAFAWSFDWAGQVEADAELLQSDDPQKRHDAVAQLGKYDVSLTEHHLMRALEDPDQRVRLAAAKALGHGGSQKVVRIMIDWLGDPDPKVKQTAVEALGNIGGPDAAAAITRTLGDNDDAVRAQAVKALGLIGQRGNANVVVALIPRLEDPKTDVKLATIAQLEELGDRRAVIPMVARFSDSSTFVRTAAVKAVGKLGDKSAVPALIRLVGDPHEEVRTAAVGALGTLGAVDAIDTLIDQLGTGTQLHHQKVAYALGQIAATPGAGTAGEDAMRTLVESLAHPQQRQGAREALRVAGKAAVPALVAHLDGRLKGDPKTAVELLEHAADPRATETLAAELERGRVPVPAVLAALGATRDSDALVPVLRALSSKDAQIRLVAMEALRPLIGTDARAGDVLLEHLDDGDIEIRVLAAEYLGMLRLGAATKRLATLAGPGNPPRLRRAAIDALGEIGRPEATAAVLAVLRDGPAGLHRSAATALTYIADATAIRPLVELAREDRPTRHEVVRALGGTVRARAGYRPDEAARSVLRELARDPQALVALAAIGGLAAAKHADDAPLLRRLVEQAPADRRRAAAWALGELRDPGSIDVLATALSARDDRLAGDAAWALGEIAAAHPSDRSVAPLVDRWLHTAKHGGWASAANSTGAVARLLWATPSENRNALLAGERRRKLLALAFHRSRLARINAAHALASLPAADDVTTALARMLRDDTSPRVRIAAARALARAGTSNAKAALQAATKQEGSALVRTALDALATTPPPSPPPARTEWRSFHIVDPSDDDAPVRHEAYFVHTPDDLVWASYTDGRGELNTEHVSPGDPIVWPASRESEY